MRLLRLFASRRQSAPVVNQRAEQRMLDSTTAGCAYFLGETEAMAATMAADAIAQRRRLQVEAPCRDAVRLAGQAQAAIVAAHANGPCLLALPCHVVALKMLQLIARDLGVQLVLVDSPAARSLLDELIPGHAIARCATHELIKRVKIASPDDAQVVYVSFPELHALTAGTTASTVFLGKSCRVSVLEPLLCLSGINTLLTVAAVNDASTAHLTIACWNAAAFRAEQHPRPLGFTLGWLWSHLQGVASAAPARMLSWHALYRASAHCQQIERDNQIKQLEAYFDAWKRSPAGLDVDIEQLAAARLAAMRDINPSGATA
jgi:hypothetical protein